MASPIKVHNILEDDLKCGICLRIMQDPRVIPNCQHTFCAPCIHRAVQPTCSDDGSLNSHSPDTAMDILKCPYCRTTIFVPHMENGEMIDFPSNTETCQMLKNHYGNLDLNDPVAITTTKADEIIVSDMKVKTTSATKIPQEILHLLTFNLKVMRQKVFSTGLENRAAVMETVDGHIAVPGGADKNVFVTFFKKNGEFYAEFIHPNYKKLLTNEGHGIAINYKDGVMVTNTHNKSGCISVWNGRGKHKFDFGRKDMGNFLSKIQSGPHFKLPKYIATNSMCDILVCDTENHCINVFDKKGNLKRMIGQCGRQNGQLLHPMGICTDESDNIIVADRDNRRIQLFSNNGRLSEILVDDTGSEGLDLRPLDVALTHHKPIKLVVLLTSVDGERKQKIEIYNYKPEFKNFKPLQRKLSLTKRRKIVNEQQKQCSIEEPPEEIQETE